MVLNKCIKSVFGYYRVNCVSFPTVSTSKKHTLPFVLDYFLISTILNNWHRDKAHYSTVSLILSPMIWTPLCIQYFTVYTHKKTCIFGLFVLSRLSLNRTGKIWSHKVWIRETILCFICISTCMYCLFLYTRFFNMFQTL